MTEHDRLGLAERDLRDHAKSLSVLVIEVGKLDIRLTALEKAEMARVIQDAREEERDKALNKRLDSIDENIKKIIGDRSKVLWAIGLAILAIVVKWALEGGLISGV